MKVLILGAAGTLGRALTKECTKLKIPHLACDRSKCDILNKSVVFNTMRFSSPDIVVCAAGATDVDKCETNREYAINGNIVGPRNVSAACRKYGVKLIHISTDYVFSGWGKHDEFAEPNPMQYYGKTKLSGENIVLNSAPDNVVLRTSWLYGEGGTNYVSRMLELLNSTPPLQLIQDTVGSPTYAKDLAKWIIKNSMMLSGGIYHITNKYHKGGLSYYELGKFVRKLYNIDCEIIPVLQGKLFRPAERPRNVILTSIMLEVEGIEGLRNMEEAYKEYINDCEGTI